MSIAPSKNPQTKHFLSIDFGKAKIGLALADSETKIAFGYDTIKNDKKFLQNLKKIIETESVSLIVLGESGISERLGKLGKGFNIKRTGEKIRKGLNVSVEYQEEMFTTKMAQNNLKEAGVKNIGKIDDKEAARIILQDWLDKKAKN